MKKIMLTSLVAMFATVAANAGMYVTGHIRTNTNEEMVYAGDDVDNKEEFFDNLFLDVAVGYKFDGGFRLETDVMNSRLYNTDDEEFTLQVLPMNLKGIWDFDMSSKFTPYVGIGLNSMSYDNGGEVSILGTKIIGDGAMEIDMFGIVGVTYELASNMMLDLQYNRTLQYNSMGDGVDASYDGVNQFKVGMRYHF